MRPFGADSLANDDIAFGKIQVALQSFQIEDASFHPYNSKYDLYLYKKPGSELTPAEARGLAVFNDPKRGNCLGCHLADASLDDGAPAQLTDFSFEAIGVPRNPQIPANRIRIEVAAVAAVDAPAGTCRCRWVRVRTRSRVAVVKMYLTS